LSNQLVKVESQTEKPERGQLTPKPFKLLHFLQELTAT